MSNAHVELRILGPRQVIVVIVIEHLELATATAAREPKNKRTAPHDDILRFESPRDNFPVNAASPHEAPPAELLLLWYPYYSGVVPASTGRRHPIAHPQPQEAKPEWLHSCIGALSLKKNLD